MLDTFVIDLKRDDSGNIDWLNIRGQFGNLPELDVLDAIVSWCEQNKREYHAAERDAFNKSIWEQAYTSPVMAKEKVDKVCQIYVVKDPTSELYKIGKAGKAEDRFRQLLTANPFLELVRVYNGKASDEKALHADFQIEGKGVLREWFRLDNSDLEKIDSHFHALAL